jgi:uncharacterized membrane protein YcaP (DUF421 family)
VEISARDLVDQAARAILFYIGVLLIVRLAGKRLAGQTTTFDLVVLISLIVSLQRSLLKDGIAHVLVFVVVVLALHRGLATACARSPRLKHLLRGEPRELVVDGQVDHAALADEGVGDDELTAGLRKLGHESPADVKVAVLEETGHISAVPRGK